MKRVLLAVAAAATLTLTGAPAAGAAHVKGRGDAYPLTVGDHGQRVRDLQWLLRGKRPNAFPRFRPFHTYRGPVDGKFGPQTATAVWRLKYRLGLPMRAVNRTAGRDLIELITGERKRPLMYRARTTKRLKLVVTARTPCATRLTQVARRELGVREIPDGSNYDCGYKGAPCRIRAYQRSTGAYRAAWCLSYLQYVLDTVRSRYKLGPGAIANRSAGVFYTVAWARDRGYLRTRPRPGALVAFMDRQGHIEIVERVTAHGIYTIGGNVSNAVRARYHWLGGRPKLFIWLPDCTLA